MNIRISECLTKPGANGTTELSCINILNEVDLRRSHELHLPPLLETEE